MIDFQAAEKKGLEEPASEIGLEPLCAMVSALCWILGYWLISSTWNCFIEAYVDIRFYVMLYLDKQQFALLWSCNGAK